MCGKQVENNNWHDRQAISVKHKNDINRRVITTFEIHLKTRVRLGGEPFWNQVEVPTIFVCTKSSGTMQSNLFNRLDVM